MHHYTKVTDAARPADPISREQFRSRIPSRKPTLEIGPFAFPAITGPKVRYFDVLDAEQIRAECDRIGLNKEKAPAEIHYLEREVGIDEINETFDVVYSGHVIERTLDLFRHLKSVSRIMAEGANTF